MSGKISIKKNIYKAVLVSVNIMFILTIRQVPFNVAVSDFLVPLCFVVVFYDVIRKEDETLFVVYYYILFTLLWILASGLINVLNPAIVSRGLNGVVSEVVKSAICLIYFYLGIKTPKYTNPYSVLNYLRTGAMIFLVYGYFAIIASRLNLFRYQNSDHSKYFIGTYTDPNHAATYITIMFSIMIIVFILEERKIWKVITSVILIMLTFAIFLTDSRGGIIGFLIMLLLYVFLLMIKNREGIILLISILMLVFMVSAIIDFTFFDNSYVGKLILGITDNLQTGFQGRMNLSKVAIAMGNDNPLFGVGRGNFALNSIDYFDSIGVEFIDNISHNTFLGLYAEVGFIGVIAFMTPMSFTIFKLVKNYRCKGFVENKYYVYIITIIAVAIQATVLNMENRRFLWFLSGFILVLIESDFLNGLSFKVSAKYNKYRYRYINIFAIVIVIGLYIYASFNVYIEKPFDRWSDVIVYDLGHVNFGENEEVELEFYLNSKANNESEILFRVVEKTSDGHEFIIDSYCYPDVNGIIKRSFFKTHKNSELEVRFDSINNSDSYRVQLLSITSNTKVYHLDRFYYLSGNITEKIYSYFRTSSNTDLYYEHNNELPLQYDFDGIFTISNWRVEKKNDAYLLKLEIEKLSELLEDYKVICYVKTDNLHDLDPKRIQNGNERLIQLNNISLYDLEVGEKEEIIYTFPSEGVNYHILFKIVYNEEGNTYEVTANDNNHFADLGWHYFAD